jgi:hypothetical protein
MIIDPSASSFQTFLIEDTARLGRAARPRDKDIIAVA